MKSPAYVWMVVAVVVLIQNGFSDGASILAWLPFSAKSHHNVFDPVLRALVERGHQVTAYKTLPLEIKPTPNYKEIMLPNFLEELKNKMDFNVVEFGKQGFIGEVMGVNEIGFLVAQDSFKTEAFKQLMKTRQKYDLIITESLFSQFSVAALSHRFQAPHVTLMALGNSHWTNFVTSNPYSPSYIPDWSSGTTSKMSYWQRLQNSFRSLVVILLTQFHYIPKFQRQVDEFFVYEGSSSRPELSKMLSNISLVLENSHVVLNGAAPKAPNLVSVGGLHIKPNKPLPADLKKWLDEAKEGVIYFSYGTVVQGGHLDDRVKQTFLKVFSKLRQRVLWKMDQKMQLPSNVRAQAWLPQQDILAHGNVVLFITHGGYLSVNEAVHFGVPLVGTPFFGDQVKNLNQVTQDELGVRLDYENITEESLSWAVNEILGSNRYKEAMKKQSSIYRDRQSSALDTAVYWIEYVLRHDGAHHLKPYSSFMPWYQAELLDVLPVLLLPVFILFLMLRKLYLFLTCQTCRKNRNKQKTS